MVRVDLRTVVLDIPPQDLITRDNVPAKVNAVTYFRVIDATQRDRRGRAATWSPPRRSPRPRCARSSARPTSTCCSAERERLNEALQQIIDEQTDPWGVKVTAVEIKHVEIPGGDAARDGAPGRGRARAPREGHPRRGRVPGLPTTPRRRRGDQRPIPPRSSCATCRRSPRSAPTRTRRSCSHSRSTSSGRSWRVPARRPTPPAARSWRARQTSPPRSVPATAATGSSTRRDDPPKRRRSAIAAAPNDRSMLAAAVCMRSAAAGRRAGRQRSA